MKKIFSEVAKNARLTNIFRILAGIFLAPQIFGNDTIGIDYVPASEKGYPDMVAEKK